MTLFHDRSSGEHVELGNFDPTSKDANYSGTAYQYKAGDKRNSKNVANLNGRNFADDAQIGVPNHATTDFREQPSPKNLKSFTPNDHRNNSGAWN